MGIKLYKLSETCESYKAGMRTYLFHCPGCGFGHSYTTNYPTGEKGPKWTFNGDMEKPTFTPSLLYQYTRPLKDEEVAKVLDGEKVNVKKEICHLYVRNGRIDFLSDCTHKLAGQSVEMADIDKD